MKIRNLCQISRLDSPWNLLNYRNHYPAESIRGFFQALKNENFDFRVAQLVNLCAGRSNVCAPVF